MNGIDGKTGPLLRALTPQVTETDARKRLRPRASFPSRLIHGPLGGNASSTRPVLHLEMVWMPHYLIEFETREEDGAAPLGCLVDGRTGDVCRIDPSGQPIEEMRAATELAPRFGPEEAKERARGRLCVQMRIAKYRSELGPARSVEMLYYPYWVQYHERRRGKIDIRMLDAVTGSKPGLRLKTSLLAAFREVAAKNRREDGA